MTRRALRQITYCVLSAASGSFGFAVVALLLVPGAAATVTVIGTVFGFLAVVLALRAARGFGGLQRRLLARLAGVAITEPPSFEPGRGFLGRIDRRLRDRTAWRAVAYAVARLPILAAQFYIAVVTAFGVADLSYPVLFRLFRNAPAGTVLRPVRILSPVSLGGLSVVTLPGTVLAAAIGLVWLVAAGLLARPVVAADARLARALLGPGALAERVRELERTRSLAVDDAAAALRRVERDLHDGAQVRLTALTMHLGMAREKAEADAPDLAAVRELLAAAQGNAAGALAELRDLARGIHPPTLDNGLADALASLAAASAVPVTVRVDLPGRPSPAIETIAYFCAAELVANAIKHSYAGGIEIRVDYPERTRVLVMTVTDDGVGGADPARGSGLAGLIQRVSTVDGRLDVSSPPDGPTVVTVELPGRA